jgi:hypothetical protein
MTSWTALGADWLPQLAAAAGDTLLVKNVAPEPSTWERVTSIASGLVSITLLVLTAALVPAAWNFRKSYKKVSDLLDRVYADINPIAKHASQIADNVDYITTSIRVDVQEVNRTIAMANDRLREAVSLTERRLHDFNALLQVVQKEAEDAFVSSASTLRGVRTGAAAFHQELGDDQVHDDGMDVDDAFFDADEVSDGDDSTTEAESRHPGPRIRSRSRRERPA